MGVVGLVGFLVLDSWIVDASMTCTRFLGVRVFVVLIVDCLCLDRFSSQICWRTVGPWVLLSFVGGGVGVCLLCVLVVCVASW